MSDTPAFGLLRAAKPIVSFISRLDRNRKFQVVAVVPAYACLLHSPDGEHVYLMTSLRRPEPIGGNRDGAEQDVIFQSDDQGQTWRWRKEGFFPEADSWPPTF
ncbi:MAG: hypothetical protein ABIN96_14795 [Rubrivivax sp.]